MSLVNISIDGTKLEVESGTTIMAAAATAGIYTPSICSHPDLPPGGICGLCAVKGRDEPVSACETLVENGMAVRKPILPQCKTCAMINWLNPGHTPTLLSYLCPAGRLQLIPVLKQCVGK